MQSFEKIQEKLAKVLDGIIYSIENVDEKAWCYSTDSDSIETRLNKAGVSYTRRDCETLVVGDFPEEKENSRRIIGRGELDFSQESDRAAAIKLLRSGISIAFINGEAITVRDIEAIPVLLAAGIMTYLRKISYKMYS